MHSLILTLGVQSPPTLHKRTPIALTFLFSNYHCITKETSPCCVCDSLGLCYKPPREAFE